MIYVVCNRNYAALEVAFKTKEDAVNWIGDQRYRYYVVAVELITPEGEEVS